MVRQFKNKILIVTTIVLSLNAHALQWVCTPTSMIVGSNKVKQIEQLDAQAATSAAAVGLLTSGGRNYNARINTRLAAQVYSGDQILVGVGWLNACMFKSHDPLTKKAFSYLSAYGVASPEASEKFAKMPGIFDRTVKLVSTDQDMISCIESNPPAIGYVNFYGGGNVVPCN
jgi:hypothetical protein